MRNIARMFAALAVATPLALGSVVTSAHAAPPEHAQGNSKHDDDSRYPDDPYTKDSDAGDDLIDGPIACPDKGCWV